MASTPIFVTTPSSPTGRVQGGTPHPRNDDQIPIALNACGHGPNDLLKIGDLDIFIHHNDVL